MASESNLHFSWNVPHADAWHLFIKRSPCASRHIQYEILDTASPHTAVSFVAAHLHPIRPLFFSTAYYYLQRVLARPSAFPVLVRSTAKYRQERPGSAENVAADATACSSHFKVSISSVYLHGPDERAPNQQGTWSFSQLRRRTYSVSVYSIRLNQAGN